MSQPSLAALVDGIRDARFVAGGRAPGALDCAGAALLVLERLGRPLPPDALPAPGGTADTLLAVLCAGRLDPAEQLALGDLLLSSSEGPHLAAVVALDPALVITVTRRQGGLLLLAARVPGLVGRYRVEECQAVDTLLDTSDSHGGFLFAGCESSPEDPA